MGELYPLLGDQATAAKLRRLLRALPAAGGFGALGQVHREISPGRIRIGVVYGGITAANYDGLALQSLGVGEVKFHKIKHDGSELLELDDEPTKAFSLQPNALVEDQEVVCFRDLTVKDPANESTPQPGWLAVPVTAAAGRSGWGMFFAGGTTSPTDPAVLTNLTSQTIELVNNDDLDPVVSAQVAVAGPPVEYDRLIANDSGNYRITFGAKLVFPTSPAEPGAPLSFQSMQGTVTSNGTAIGAGNVIGTTQDFCLHKVYRRERFLLMKNANFGAPNVADTIAQADVWVEYRCGVHYFGHAHYSRPIELNAGDTLSIWRDVNAAVNSYVIDFFAEMSLHYESREVELS